MLFERYCSNEKISHRLGLGENYVNHVSDKGFVNRI